MKNHTSLRLYRMSIIVAIIAAVFTIPAAQQQQSGPALLRAAVDKETMEGDIRAAVKAYESIARTFAQSDRPVAARALLHLAQAHRKLGSAEAERVYRDVLRRYPEQAEVVAAARNDLAALRAPVPRRVSGSICTDCVGPYLHSFTMSPDGRWFGYTEVNNEVMARNLQTGEVKRIVAVPPESRGEARFRARRGVWSRDGRTLAFQYRDVNATGPFKDRSYLRLITMGSRDEPRTLVDNPDFIYVFPAAWSADGRAILVSIQRRDFTWQLAWVSAESGAVTVLRSLQWDFDEFRNGPELSPDGRYIAYATYVAAVEPPMPGRTTPRITVPESRTIHVLAANGSRDAVVARSERGWPSPVWKADGSAVLFVSQRNSSGPMDLWGADVRDGNPIGTPRLLKASVGNDVQLVGHRGSGALYYVQPASQSTRIFVSNTGRSKSAENLETSIGFTGNSPSWSPDGTQLAWQTWSRSGTALTVLSEKTAELKSLPLPRGVVVGRPMWKPDGTGVLMTLRDRTAAGGIAVVQVDLLTSEVRPVGTYAPREHETWTPQFALAPSGDLLVMSTAKQSLRRSLIAINLPTGERKDVVTELPTVMRATAVEENPVAFVTNTAWHPAPVLGVSAAADGRLAIGSAADGETSLVSFTADGQRQAVLYGPLRLRPWEQALVTPLGDPKWLAGNAGIALGIQKDDFSWTLMRISPDGRVEPLGTPGAPLSLPADTLAFDIAPDGKRVAYQRTITFGGELAVLDLR